MELRVGYKQTEAGVIPQDWETCTLASAAVDRGLVRGPFGGALKKEIFVDHGFKVYEQGNAIYQSIERGDYFVGRDKFREMERFQVRPGDLIVSCSGTIGCIYQIPEYAPEGVINQALLKIALNDERVCVGYFLSVFQSESFQARIKENTHGGAMQNLVGMDVFRSAQFPLPSLTEQKAIAEALSDADALIESLEQLIAKKRRIKQGAMQELLTCKRRLPGSSGEWEVKRLGEIGSTFGGLTGKTKADFGTGTARYITFMNIMTNVVIDCGTFDAVQVSSTESQNRVIKGDLFFNGSSETPEEVGLCALLSEDFEDLYLNSFCFGFRMRDAAKADGLYLAYYFRSGQGRDLLKSLAQGATRYNLSKTALLRVAFPLPAAAEQVAIAAVLSDMDAKLAALEAKVTKARQIKQGMMQNLLTGRIRLI